MPRLHGLQFRRRHFEVDEGRFGDRRLPWLEHRRQAIALLQLVAHSWIAFRQCRRWGRLERLRILLLGLSGWVNQSLVVLAVPIARLDSKWLLFAR